MAFDAQGTGPSAGRLEDLPDDVVASMEVRDAWRRQVASSGGGLEFIVDDLARWVPGSDVRVAFLSGDADLHSDIEATRHHRRLQPPARLRPRPGHRRVPPLE